MSKLLTVQNDAGVQFTISSNAGDATDEQFRTALKSHRDGMPTPGFQVLDTTPPPTFGQRATRAVARTSRAISERAGPALEAVSPSMMLMERAGILPEGGTRQVGRGIAEATLPQTVSDVGRDIGLTAAGFIPGAGPLITAARIAAPALLSFLGGLFEGRSTAEATQEGLISGVTAAIPEGGRAARGVLSRIRGVKGLQKGDVRNVTIGLQRILPEGAPRLPQNVSQLAKVIDVDLPAFANRAFKKKLATINALAGKSKILVPSIDDQPITVAEAIDVISEVGIKIPKFKAGAATAQAKLTSLERSRLIEELEEGLLAAAPRNPILARVAPLYQTARSELRDTNDIVRLFKGKDVFSKETGRLNMDKLQERFLELRGSRGIAGKNIEGVEDVVSRGSGPFTQVDQPTLELPLGFFTRSGVIPGAGFRPFGGQFNIPSFVGRTQRDFARPRIQRASAAFAASTGQSLSNALRSSPFTGE